MYRRALVALVLLTVLSGCTRLRRHLFGAKRDQIELERTTFAPGETIYVTFSNSIEPNPGEDYWLTIVPAREPDSAWGEWHYVSQGTQADSVITKTPGDYEVRLHSGYPRVPYHVVARVGVVVR